MNYQRPYQHDFRDTSESYEPNTNYYNTQQYTQHEDDKFCNQDRTYGLTSRTQDSFNTKSSHARFGKYPSSQNRESSERSNESELYDSIQISQYSTYNERLYFSNQNQDYFKRSDESNPNYSNQRSQFSTRNNYEPYSQSDTANVSRPNQKRNYSINLERNDDVDLLYSQNAAANVSNQKSDGFFSQERNQLFSRRDNYTSRKEGHFSSQNTSYSFRREENNYSIQGSPSTLHPKSHKGNTYGLDNASNSGENHLTYRNYDTDQDVSFTSRKNKGNNAYKFPPKIEQDFNQSWKNVGSFGQVKRGNQSSYNESFKSNDLSKRIKIDSNSAAQTQRYDKVPSEIERDVREGEEEYCDEADYNDDGEEGDKSDDEVGEVYAKKDLFIPNEQLIEKYKYFPPSAEEMGKLFNDLVIYFFYKRKDSLEKNPFVIVCESFRRSERYEAISVEDGYKFGMKDTKYCTLRWKGMMMMRGVGYTGVFKEPRLVAGIELINKLAMTCYTLKMKNSFYGKRSVEKLITNSAHSKIARIVERAEVTNFESACAFITNFFKDDNDFELMFFKCNFQLKLKCWCVQNGYDCRVTQWKPVLRVSLMRSPQYWRDKILASGRMENDRFQLIPPQGIGNELMKNPIFSAYQGFGMQDNGSGPRTLYSDNNTELKLRVCITPWDRHRGSRRKGKGKNKKKWKGKRGGKKKNKNKT